MLLNIVISSMNQDISVGTLIDLLTKKHVTIEGLKSSCDRYLVIQCTTVIHAISSPLLYSVRLYICVSCAPPLKYLDDGNGQNAFSLPRVTPAYACSGHPLFPCRIHNISLRPLEK